MDVDRFHRTVEWFVEDLFSTYWVEELLSGSEVVDILEDDD